MFKILQNNTYKYLHINKCNIYKKIFSFFSTFFSRFLFIFLFVFLFINHVNANIQVYSFLGDLYNNLSNSTSDLYGKAKVSELYKTSLGIVKNKDFVPIYHTIDNIIKDYTNLNCAISHQDVFNIFSFNNPTEYSKIKQYMANTLNDESVKDLVITSNEISKSCDKINKCLISNGISNINCYEDVLNKYSVIIQSTSNLYSLSDSTIGSDLFQNGTLEDSDYDLMIDLENIGKVLFEDFKAPIETVFYKMPKISDDAFRNDIQEVGLSNLESSTDFAKGNLYGSLGVDTKVYMCPKYDIDGNILPNKNILNDIISNNNTSSSNILGNTLLVTNNVLKDSDLMRINPSITSISNKENSLGIMGDACIIYESCGNGIKEGTEQCDDGNKINGDGCNSVCVLEYCGDGILQQTLGEQCDDGNNNNNDSCTNNCILNICGDGYLHDGIEECDDGNNISGDGCSKDCKLEWIGAQTYCGDGIVSGLEECDDGNDSNNDSCTNFCKLNICGDGYLWTHQEQCDDGNDVSGDGCSSLCQNERLPNAEYCGDGIVQEDLGEECDDGNNNNNDSCTNTCKLNVCGDGLIYEGLEECDDGNNNDYDCCTNDCKAKEYITPEEKMLGDMYESILELESKDESPILDGCLQKCSDLSISDKLICIAQCACGQISSPEIKIEEQSFIKEGAFRLKFCMIAPKSIEITRGKSVMSIESIFLEMKNVLTALRDGGQTLKSTKPKELLDSSMKKNKFSDIFAFNVTINFKSLFGHKRTKESKIIEEIKINQNLKEGISNIGKVGLDAPHKRNKYVVIADIANNKAMESEFESLDQLQNMIEKEIELLTNRISRIDSGIQASELQKYAVVNESIMVFLRDNMSFWVNVNQMFLGIKESVFSLKNKIK